MHRNAETLTRFYTAFANLDADTMASCYADDVEFEDEVFTLHGKREVSGMWHMLADATKAKSRDAWKLEFSNIEADDTRGKAHWDATYRFSATGRMVLNRIDGSFTFNPQGLILRHRDRFNFWTWSRQALGTPGLLLGWTPVLRQKVRATAAGNLAKYLSSQPA